MQLVEAQEDWNWTETKYSDTNMVFQTDVFVILVVINNRSSLGVNGKTTDYFFRICLCYH